MLKFIACFELGQIANCISLKLALVGQLGHFRKAWTVSIIHHVQLILVINRRTRIEYYATNFSTLIPIKRLGLNVHGLCFSGVNVFAIDYVSPRPFSEEAITSFKDFSQVFKCNCNEIGTANFPKTKGVSACIISYCFTEDRKSFPSQRFKECYLLQYYRSQRCVLEVGGWYNYIFISSSCNIFSKHFQWPGNENMLLPAINNWSAIHLQY